MLYCFALPPYVLPLYSYAFVMQYSFLILLSYSRALYDKRISQEVPGEDLGEDFTGYVSHYLYVYHILFNILKSLRCIFV